MTRPKPTRRPGRRPAYSTVVKALRSALDELADDGHDGSPPSWSTKCRKCAVVRDLLKIHEAATWTPPKPLSKRKRRKAT